MDDKKCHNCKGTGNVPTTKGLRKHPEINGKYTCYYCMGKGYRMTKYS